MPVHALVKYHVQEGMSAERIVSEVYTHLELAQVYAALAYYYANRSEIEDIWAEDARWFDEMRRQFPDGLGPERFPSLAAG